MSTETAPTASKTLLILAFAIVYVVWGSTYVANITAIETIPPFVLVTARLCLAGGLLLAGAYGAARLRSATWTWPTRLQWRNLSVTSILFLTIGMGAVVWAEQYIESSTTALLVAAEPLLVVLVLWAFERKRPRWQAFAGIALGMLGTVVLVGQDIVIGGDGAWLGIGAILVGISAWAVGSVLTSRLELPNDRLQTAGLQMLIAGLAAIPLIVLSGEWTGFEFTQISARSWWSFAFLVLFGSVVAYSSFLYLLKNVSPEKVATSTYVHPVVALVLGVALRGEAVTLQTLVACAILLSGVLFVNGRWGRRAKAGETLVQPRQAMRGPILRRWTGRAVAGRRDELLQHLEAVVLPDLRAQPGNLRAELVDADEEQVRIESTWQDDKALSDFFGEQIEEPRRYAAHSGLLVSDQHRIEHYPA